MKTIILLGGILFCMQSSSVTAQPPVPAILAEKPSLFSDFPDEFAISVLAIQKLFAGASTGYIKIPVENHGFFEGYVMEKVRRSSALLTVNIRLTNYDGALFTLSRITGDDEKVSYTGRIVHRNYNDALIIVNTDGKISLKKEKQSLLLVE